MLPLIPAAVSVATLFENNIPVPVAGHVCLLINGHSLLTSLIINCIVDGLELSLFLLLECSNLGVASVNIHCMTLSIMSDSTCWYDLWSIHAWPFSLSLSLSLSLSPLIPLHVLKSRLVIIYRSPDPA